MSAVEHDHSGEHDVDLTRERLVEAAAAVFAERGYDGAGVQEVARRAGLTTGAIYGRFSGKAELLREAIAASSSDELTDPRARPEAMATFAKATGGDSFASNQAAQLLSRLDHRTPTTASQMTTVAIWDLPAVMAIFIAILCFDSLVRKRRGMV